jgi:hypothetical protein
MMRLSAVVLATFALVASGCGQTTTGTGPATLPPCPVASRPATSSSGVISGQLQFPSDFVPPLTLYAVPVEGMHASSVRSGLGCYLTMQTVFDQTVYHFLGVPPGTYFVLAAMGGMISQPAVSPGSRIAVVPSRFGGAYTLAVLCYASGARTNEPLRCDDHSLLPVTVEPGQTVSGADIVDWYTDPNFYPQLPSDAARPTVLPAAASAFASSSDAAVWSAQAQTGGLYASGASQCPINRACVWFEGGQHDGVGAAYFLGRAGSNNDLLFCAAYTYRDSAGWHDVGTNCRISVAFPAVGATGAVFSMGTDCVNVRAHPGRKGAIVGCLPSGTEVMVDEGPTYVPELDPSLAPRDQLWWHLKGHGWMVHRCLVFC